MNPEQYCTVGRISTRGKPKLSNRNREYRVLKGVSSVICLLSFLNLPTISSAEWISNFIRSVRYKKAAATVLLLYCRVWMSKREKSMYWTSHLQF